MGVVMKLYLFSQVSYLPFYGSRTIAVVTDGDEIEARALAFAKIPAEDKQYAVREYESFVARNARFGLSPSITKEIELNFLAVEEIVCGLSILNDQYE